MQSRDYFLRSHIFFCLTETFCFILDLKMDRYLSLDSRSFKSLGPHLHGWPAKAFGTSAGSELAPAAASLAAELVAAGILGMDRNDSKEARPTTWRLPTHTLLDRPEHASALYCTSIFANFLKATTRVNRQLRESSLESIIGSIAKRREAYARVVQAFDRDCAKLTSAFSKLRPVFPRNYLCLFDSIALIEFLSQYRIFPTLVFGVRPEPFGAHCWVQMADMVLNDTVEYASAFTPIMAI